jgi:hypothetical protein
MMVHLGLITLGVLIALSFEGLVGGRLLKEYEHMLQGHDQ